MNNTFKGQSRTDKIFCVPAEQLNQLNNQEDRQAGGKASMRQVRLGQHIGIWGRFFWGREAPPKPAGEAQLRAGRRPAQEASIHNSYSTVHHQASLRWPPWQKIHCNQYKQLYPIFLKYDLKFVLFNIILVIVCKKT